MGGVGRGVGRDRWRLNPADEPPETPGRVCFVFCEKTFQSLYETVRGSSGAGRLLPLVVVVGLVLVSNESIFLLFTIKK